MNDSKIYIVVAGEYSDKHIIGATKAKPTAEKIVKQAKALDGGYNNDARILEFDDAVIADMPLKSYYIVRFNPKFQFVSAVKILVDYELSDYDELVTNKVAESYFTDSDYLVKVYACSLEQAKKIAIDIMARYKAEKAGIA